jgi:uncharacterized protein YgbK (DUF1537 family)
VKFESQVRKECEALLVADDLTGACDSGIAFAQYGFDTRVLFGTSVFQDGETIAVSTNSRRLTVREAAKRVEVACGMVPIAANGLLFKKIDSTLRGHVVAECDAMMLSTSCRLGVMAPALPSQSRTVAGGRLQVRDLAGNWELDVRELLAEQGASDVALLEASHLTSSAYAMAEMTRLASTGVRYILCDATEDEELACIAEALMHCEERVLWIGSAGLASAAAKLLATRRPNRARANIVAGKLDETLSHKVVFCVGSDHAVTQLQLKHLKDAVGLQALAVSSAGAMDVQVALGVADAVIFAINTKNPEPQRLRELLYAAQNCGMESMVLSGGDTAEMICQAVEAQEILLTSEILGGVAMGRLRGGLLDRIKVATKSGGFGDQRCLEEVMHLLRVPTCTEDQVYL